MIIRVDPDLPLPVYEQIREQVVRMIVSGTLAEGVRLPTIRQLANDLRLAKGTVAKAYALLEQSRVVESRGHKGTFVCARPADVAADEDALGNAAKTFATVASQLGVELDDAKRALEKHWWR